MGVGGGVVGDGVTASVNIDQTRMIARGNNLVARSRFENDNNLNVELNAKLIGFGVVD